MNQTGEILLGLQKLGYRLRSLLVVHDELEKPFGALQLKDGGSARGHNGLRSLMRYGDMFWRIRFGIGRPENKEDVPDYVLEPFTRAEEEKLPALIAEAIQLIELAIVSEKE
jgi:PTH1 family peptidyl-tRNA hydrolase